MYVFSLNVFIAQTSIGLGLCQLLLFLVSLFLILLVLVQRGKGGGLTGALGGMGGQSAFGTKAGDAFTRITIITTLIWITLCMITISRFNPPPAARVTKKMTLMEKARALDHSPSIGAPAEAGDVPSDFSGEAASMGAGAGSDVSADEDNVAVKQTPENTASEGTAAASGGSDTEDTTVEGAMTEGTATEGAAVEGTTIEGAAVEGVTIEGAAVEGTPIEVPAGEATSEVPAIEIK